MKRKQHEQHQTHTTTLIKSILALAPPKKNGSSLPLGFLQRPSRFSHLWAILAPNPVLMRSSVPPKRHTFDLSSTKSPFKPPPLRRSAEPFMLRSRAPRSGRPSWSPWGWTSPARRPARSAGLGSLVRVRLRGTAKAAGLKRNLHETWLRHQRNA